MLAGIASLVFIPLLAIVMVQVMWAFGARFPARDEATLARTVIGKPGIVTMPRRIISFLAALLVFAAGLWALSLSDPEPNLVLDIGGAALAAAFLIRGIAGYTSTWRNNHPEEPFKTFDRKVYSPLSIGVGLGFALLTFLNATPF
ncbi:MAG: DUF3995 domain-containing protein [Hyphomicrobiaceae bacterium]|nr:DUF3995 domain-containing protein [Hyphomicrobiaceae bacterium]